MVIVTFTPRRDAAASAPFVRDFVPQQMTRLLVQRPLRSAVRKRRQRLGVGRAAGIVLDMNGCLLRRRGAPIDSDIASDKA
jgi:hypothetical protein